ncbi:MAG TPA: Rne/Rng family ribonuclease [Marmoricola sp.]|nr:Rne/Rng family ribonuclease [Marmoricola sp.]
MLDADDNNTTATTTPQDAPAADAVAGAEVDPDPVEQTAAKTAAKKTAAKKATAKKAAAKTTAAKKTTAKTTAKKAAAKKTTAKKTTAKKTATGKAPGAEPPATEGPEGEAPAAAGVGEPAAAEPGTTAPVEQGQAQEPAQPRKRATRSRKRASEEPAQPEAQPDAQPEAAGSEAQDGSGAAGAAPTVLFQPPEKPRRSTRKKAAAAEPGGDGSAAPAAPEAAQGAPDEAAGGADATTEPAAAAAEQRGSEAGEEGDGAGGRRRRRRGGRRRRKGGESEQSEGGEEQSAAEEEPEGHDDQSGDGGGSRRRRKRRRAGDESESGDDPEKTVTRVRKPRNPEDEITSVSGSTRLEAKKQRRREGREAGRRRAPIVSEAEFLARREAVERVMAIRQRDDLTQIAVLEDGVLVEHYVARETQTSLIGNVYLGRVQNVLPSMEAAFIDIGKGRNAVLYAGEVNWTALGHPDGQPRKIESVLSAGQAVLVQVTKDPIGHKGARLTGQISLPGRFLVYVPDGTTSGISRKLPDTERNRLKTLLKEIVPDTAGVIVRTAAEGASEEELTHDVERLTARWSDIEQKVAAGKAPELLYGEPDLTLKVVRDLFTEDFSRLVVQGADAWDLVEGYVSHVAPDLRERLERFPSSDAGEADGQATVSADGRDVFAAYRIDEQIAKALDRKVWLPSGGSLIIDRTEAMTVIDVNTGKFTGSGGNLEETVTKNNLEAAEEIVRQLRLRDIGGIIVVDFIDMVLESNRDLVLRRMVECLGRDRTRHQVAEVTSLGLVQMTRKRIGTGLLESFSEECPHCRGRGLLLHEHPVEQGKGEDEQRGRRGRGRGRGKSGGNGSGGGGDGSGGGRKAAEAVKPSPMALAGSRPHPSQDGEVPEEGSEAGPEERFEEGPGEDTGRHPEGADVDSAVSATSTPDGVEPEAATSETMTSETTTSGATAAETAGPDLPASPEVVEAPRVVTTTRRRSVRRPAGAPVPRADDRSEEQPGSEEAAGPADDPTGEQQVDEEHPEAVVAHVPVKRKGARKR